jgi:myosin-5
VVSHNKGERTYHIFYQLLAAPDLFKEEVWDGLRQATTDDFKYLSSSDYSLKEHEMDANEWSNLQESLKIFKLEGESLKTMLRALCIILQLGNLTFDDSSGGSIISSRDELESLSHLLGIDCENKFEISMTTRVMRTANDKCFVKLCPSAAKGGCDALAKEIYANVSVCLVAKINKHTKTSSSEEQLQDQGAENLYLDANKLKQVNVLDIFGFESFKINGFEQFCINYVNEKL